jgi:hypothetical protein
LSAIPRNPWRIRSDLTPEEGTETGGIIMLFNIGVAIF